MTTGQIESDSGAAARPILTTQAGGRPRTMVADDHVLLAEGVRKLLEPHCDVIGIAPDGRRLVEMVALDPPDVVLLDITMPELNGIEAARQISKIAPQTKIIFITQHSDRNYVRAAFLAGGSAYVLKQAAATELSNALEQVLAGKRYITPTLAPPGSEEALDSGRNPAELFGRRLTDRQREVLQLLAEGKAAKEVAWLLKISPKTVEFHKASIMQDLGLRSTAELARYAMQTGMVGPVER